MRFRSESVKSWGLGPDKTGRSPKSSLSCRKAGGLPHIRRQSRRPFGKATAGTVARGPVHDSGVRRARAAETLGHTHEIRKRFR
jgi:hypothetical protein